MRTTLSERRQPGFPVRIPIVCWVPQAPQVHPEPLRGATLRIFEAGLLVLLQGKLRPGVAIQVELQTGWGPLLLAGQVTKRGSASASDGEWVQHVIRLKRMTREQRAVFETFLVALIEAASLRGL